MKLATYDESMALWLTGDQQADELLTSSPLALLLGMVLDQQIPLERAFRAPAELARRLGQPLDALAIAALDPDSLATVFSQPPALHRFPSSMARRCHDVCAVVADHYENDASLIWTTAASGTDLFGRIKALPGFGDMKAKIFIALLGKQLGLTVPGWQTASEPYSDAGATRSLADITDAASLDAVRAFKASAKSKGPR